MSPLLLQQLLCLCVITLLQLTSGSDDDGKCEDIDNVLQELDTLNELQTTLSQLQVDVVTLTENCTTGELKQTEV